MLQCPRCGQRYPDDVRVCPSDFTPLQADVTVAEEPVDRMIGHVFDGKYRLDEQLGGGGMGTVYRATHLLIDRTVAVKVLSQRFLGDETAQQRFHREARAAGRMQHPNAVTVTDFGATSDGYLYIVMELLEGRTLRDLLAREGPLDAARAVSIMLQTSAAVAAAHDAGLIHRDLKPANIFIAQRPNLPSIVKVLDFGVAKFMVEEQEDDDYQTLTQVGAVIGTPRYMSPEQCAGGAKLSPASDVYSLGIILYEMLAGAPPFNAETPLAIALRHVSEAPRPLRELAPKVPMKLNQIVGRALEKNPPDRFADANELRHELLAAAQELGLEHATTQQPSIETLRSAGSESPSGSLVIDKATLRQVQAASSSTATRPSKFARLNILLPEPARRWFSGGRRIVLLAMIAFVAVIAIAAVTSRWWSPSPAVSLLSPSAAQSSPSPTPEASPSPSPTPEARRHEPRVQRRRPKSLLDKLKGIFKHK